MKVTLKAARISAGITQEEAASAAGVSKRTICSWEANKTAPTITQMFRLCDAYGCKVDDIFLPDMLAKSE